MKQYNPAYLTLLGIETLPSFPSLAPPALTLPYWELKQLAIRMLLKRPYKLTLPYWELKHN